MLSLRQAAQETGKSKSTIQRSISKGKMSAKRNEAGEYEIDPAELFRVYPKQSAKASALGKGKPSHELLHKLDMLQNAIEHKQELLEREQQERRRERDQFEGQITDLRNTVETLEKQNGATLQLIADEVQKVAEDKGLFARWFKKPSQ